jgi:hypothetical protein
MEVFKRLGLWCAAAQAIALLALGTPGLLTPGGRAAVWVTFLMGAFGIVGSMFAKQVLGKSDEVRLADAHGSPQDRAGDPTPPKPPEGA